MKRKNSRLLAVAVLVGSLVPGCVDGDESRIGAVDTSMAPLTGGDHQGVIPDRYIVVFKDTVAAQGLDAAMGRIALTAGSRIEHTYTIIPGFSAQLSRADLAAIRRNPDVAYVEHDQVVEIATSHPLPGGQPDGLDRVDETYRRPSPPEGLDLRYDDRDCTGSGISIYVIDTGIRTTHTEFTGRVDTARGFTAITDGMGFQDCHGHGTHVASTAAGTKYGMAKQATVIPVRVLGCSGSGTLAGLIAGIQHVVETCGPNRTCVANLSVTGPFSTALDDAVAGAVATGISFVVAAGNDQSSTCTGSPAHVPSAITVAAVDDQDCVAPFTNLGSCVDLFAPGASILGADKDSDTDSMVISGTSMATPHVAGAIAELMSCRGWMTPATIALELEAAATRGVIRTRTNTQVAPNLLLYNEFSGAVRPDSCEGRCGVYTPGRRCQCDVACAGFGDCCSDLASLCEGTSCQGRCGEYDPTAPFQCDTACTNYGDCAADFATTCTCSP